jgi:hypothetical protein
MTFGPHDELYHLHNSTHGRVQPLRVCHHTRNVQDKSQSRGLGPSIYQALKGFANCHTISVKSNQYEKKKLQGKDELLALPRSQSVTKRKVTIRLANLLVKTMRVELGYHPVVGDDLPGHDREVLVEVRLSRNIDLGDGCRFATMSKFECPLRITSDPAVRALAKMTNEVEGRRRGTHG